MPSRLPHGSAPAFLILLLAATLHASAQQLIASNPIPTALPDAPSTTSAPELTGTVTDPNGDAVDQARVTITSTARPEPHTEVTGPDGHFHFLGLSPGSVELTVEAAGLTPWSWSGPLHPNESFILPPIALRLAPAETNVVIQASFTEVAAAEVALEEKQRVLGFFPNFYAVYLPGAAPLTSRQKFGMAWKTMTDPVMIASTGVIAGWQQSQNNFSGYGQGTEGYAKRFASGYTDLFISTMLGGAILPSVLHQDPRYFVKGTGSNRSRVLYAVASTVICKSDRGRWQPNYSSILGNIASAGISNLYYPQSNRHGATLTVENSFIGTAGGAFGSLMQEFVLRRMTPHIPDYEAASAR